MFTGTAIVWCWCILSIEAKIIEPLPNGLIVIKHENAKLVAAKHEVLVILEKPEWPHELQGMIAIVKRKITDLPHGDVFTEHDKTLWTQRVDKLKSKLDRPRTRGKRGLFDFIGKASKSLFGTATTEDVENVKNVLRAMQHTMTTSIHRVNELLIVVNHTNNDIQLNRNRINLVNRQVQKMSIVLERLAKFQSTINDKLLKLKRHIIIERIVSQLEREVFNLHQLEETYLLRKQHLESDRLTEEILPLSKLREVIGTTVKDTELISPNEWYYENSVIHPIWTGTDLVYRVSLVLTRHDTYTLYEFKALPYPTANKFVTQTLRVRQWYLEETMTGRYIQVSDCRGHSPVVCYGNLVLSKPSTCERALVRGNKKGIKDCALILSKTTERIQQLDVNQFGLTTEGVSPPNVVRALSGFAL